LVQGDRPLSLGRGSAVLWAPPRLGTLAVGVLPSGHQRSASRREAMNSAPDEIRGERPQRTLASRRGAAKLSSWRSRPCGANWTPAPRSTLRACETRPMPLLDKLIDQSPRFTL
jgi:hypothetical protein